MATKPKTAKKKAAAKAKTKAKTKVKAKAKTKTKAKAATGAKKRVAAAKKKPVVKKKAAAKKAPAKKAAAKKAAAKKTAAKKTTVKKAATKKATAKKAATKTAAKKAPAKKAAPKKVAAKKAPAKKAEPAKKAAPAPKPEAKPAPAPKPVKEAPIIFGAGDFVVYPTHGVGQVTGIETQEIAGHKLKLYVISFDDERMTLRVPTSKVDVSGLRKISSRKVMDVALNTLKGRARVKRTMWSRRAQEYEAKINSGDPVAIAEVVRDLHRNTDQPDQSFSERQIYEGALERLVNEVAAVEKADKEKTLAKLEQLLKSSTSKSATASSAATGTDASE